MQKQVNFFEQHVEWFALGLGGLFLLWMVFSYVLSPPVTANVAGRTLGPGEIDPVTLNGPVAQLKREIEKRDIPEIPQRDYVQAFIAAIEGDGQAVAQLSPTGINSVPVTRLEGLGADTAVADAKTPIEVLPKPPAARPVTFVTGRSTVSYPDPEWEPDPRRPQLQQPMIEADKDWASLSFTIPAESLARAFKAAFDEKKLLDAGLDPYAFMQTAIVDVEVVRQQILPGGKVGKEEVVKPLLNSIRPPFPGQNATEFEVFNYLNFVTQNPSDLTYPVFYQVISGDEWTPPTEENERFAALDREARMAQRKAQREQERQLQNQRRQQQQMQRGRPMGPPGGFMNPDDIMMEEAMEDTFVPPTFRPGMPIRPVRPVRPGQRQPGAQLQAGKFDVEAIGDIEVIVHDDTIQAGKTYRYKMRYRLLNPVYKGIRVAPPELTKDFAIDSPWSAWTRPVTMRSKIEFFLARLRANNEAEFDVFEWQNGRMIQQTVTAGPGDAIGKTGWSMVDVRGTGRKAYGLLVDETGIMHRRDPEADNPSNRYLDLQYEVELANPQVGLNR